MVQPYPDRGRALRHIQRQRAMYLYGRFPRRYMFGLDQPPSDIEFNPDLRKVFMVSSTPAIEDGPRGAVAGS